MTQGHVALLEIAVIAQPQPLQCPQPLHQGSQQGVPAAPKQHWQRCLMHT